MHYKQIMFAIKMVKCMISEYATPQKYFISLYTYHVYHFC